MLRKDTARVDGPQHNQNHRSGSPAAGEPVLVLESLHLQGNESSKLPVGAAMRSMSATHDRASRALFLLHCTT